MPARRDYGKLLNASPTARNTRFRRGVRRHACKHLCQLNLIKNNGRARLLPSWRRNGSAGVSPSRYMNWLGKVDEKMFTGGGATLVRSHDAIVRQEPRPPEITSRYTTLRRTISREASTLRPFIRQTSFKGNHANYRSSQRYGHQTNSRHA